MNEKLRELDDLFTRNLKRMREGEGDEDASEAPVAEPAPPPKARRVIRNRAALQATAPPAEQPDEVAAAATELRARFDSARQLLGRPARAERPVVEAPKRARRNVRVVNIERPVVQPAAAPKSTPKVDLAHWRIDVHVGGAEQAFYIAAADVLDASYRGAGQVAAWVRENHPGASFRLGTVERVDATL